MWRGGVVAQAPAHQNHPAHHRQQAPHEVKVRLLLQVQARRAAKVLQHHLAPHPHEVKVLQHHPVSHPQPHQAQVHRYRRA